MPHHIAVIGAGITGVTTAYLLSQEGYQVSLIEQQRYPAMETSFANGGQLSASNAEVWNRWPTVLKGLSWMLRNDAPLLVNPKPNWHKLSWMAEFFWNIRHYKANTIATARLAIAAREELFAMAERENIDFDHEKRGILHVYRNKDDYDHACVVNNLLSQGGLDRRAVSDTEIRSIEPALQERFHGGFFTESDSTGDIHKFTRGLARACERHGVRLLSDRTVLTIDGDQTGVRLATTAGPCPGPRDIVEADGVVICAGVASRKLARDLGDRLNIYPVKGYSITVNLADAVSRTAAPWVSILDDDAKIVTSRLGPDRFRVAGTAEFNDFNRDIRDDRVRPLIAWTRRLFPDVDTDSVIPWSGLRPMMPTMMPTVRTSRRQRVFYNTGHGHLGWTLAGITARMTVDLIQQTIRPT
ncbi:MAG: D-amino acid dehydrogenase [Rhodopseudomonas sp.]|nr:D-amino acid dehydrogenase [Rhodopseudomonas sp.]